MKKLSLVLALLLCLCLSSPALAAAPVAVTAPPVAIMDYPVAVAEDGNPIADSLSLLRWEETSSITHGVSITSSGYLTASCNYKTYTSTNKVYITCTLQKLSGSSYADTSYSWPASGTGSASLSKSLYVSKGTYRLKTVGEVYDRNGNYIETVTVYSTSQSYT